MKYRRYGDERYMSSSSECLNYGPVDPLERLPFFNDAFKGKHIKQRSAKRHDRKFITNDMTNSTPLNKRLSGSIDNLVPTGSVLRGSDSAYSLSPLVTENSRERSNSLSSLANDNHRKSNDHTYINISASSKNDKTKFEEISDLEKSLPSALHISNV